MTTCSPHPDAPHGFDRNRSHNEQRYVCTCEGWELETPQITVERVRRWKEHWQSNRITKASCMALADAFIRVSEENEELVEKCCDLHATVVDMKERQNNLLKAIHEIQQDAGEGSFEEAALQDVVHAFHRELYSRR